MFNLNSPLMSVFHKSANFSKNISFQHKIKLGNAFLDSIIHQVNQGTLILVEEDEFTTNHLLLAKTFIAQNAFQSPIVFSLDHKDFKIPTQNLKELETTHETMKIAWRYENIKHDATENKFDFKKPTPYSIKKDVGALLKDLEAMDRGSVIAILSLFSPAWDVADFEEFLYRIRRTIKEKDMVLLATVPTFMYKTNFYLYFDIALQFKALTFDESLKNYSGLIEIKKNHPVGFVEENSEDTWLYGYVVSRFGLQIERIDVPPEDAEVSGCHVQDMF